MKYFFLAATAALVACADLSPTAPVSSPAGPRLAVDVNETTPVALTLVNPCTGEPVALTGNQHFVFRTTETPSGGFSYGLSLTQTLTGVGAFGTKYNARFSFDDQGMVSAPFPVILYFAISTDVISTGPAGEFRQDFHTTLTYKLTINANGTATVERTTSSERCNGQPVG